MADLSEGRIVKVTTRRYVNVKTYKQPIGLCIITGCRTSATVKATNRQAGLSMDVRLCQGHAEQGGIT